MSDTIKNTRRHYAALNSFFRLEIDAMRDFFACFWVDMNIIGKVLFFPVLIMGTAILPVAIPLLACVMRICTWRPGNE